MNKMSDFKGLHFSGQVILRAICWYCKYGISYREFGESDIKAKDNGKYPYRDRAIINMGGAVDFYLPSIHSAKAAQQCLSKALRSFRSYTLNTDKNRAYLSAVEARS